MNGVLAPSEFYGHDNGSIGSGAAYNSRRARAVFNGQIEIQFGKWDASLLSECAAIRIPGESGLP